MYSIRFAQPRNASLHLCLPESLYYEHETTTFHVGGQQSLMSSAGNLS